MARKYTAFDENRSKNAQRYERYKESFAKSHTAYMENKVVLKATIDKEKGEKVKEHCKNTGVSVSKYLENALDIQMKKDGI